MYENSMGYEGNTQSSESSYTAENTWISDVLRIIQNM